MHKDLVSEIPKMRLNAKDSKLSVIYFHVQIDENLLHLDSTIFSRSREVGRVGGGL